MTTFNTGNPIGSAAAKDLYDNAENLDELVNSDSKLSHPDRLGVPRKTWHGMEQDFQQFLINSGYEDIGDYGPGLEITARNQIFWRDGELYRAGATLELPYTTTGDWEDEEGLFVAVGDAALRQELSSPDKGALIVKNSALTVDTIDDLLSLNSTGLIVPGARVYVKEVDKAGYFTWSDQDESAMVSQDPSRGIYVASGDGSSGAWVRQYDGPYKSTWTGANLDLIPDFVSGDILVDYETATGSAAAVNRTDRVYTTSKTGKINGIPLNKSRFTGRVLPPDGFPWTPPIAIFKNKGTYEVVDAIGLYDLASHANGVTRFWVDIKNGIESDSGQDESAPTNSLWRAIERANALGVNNCIIYVASGVYNRTVGWNGRMFNGNLTVICEEGTYLTTAEPSSDLTWISEGSGVYSAIRSIVSNYHGAIDMSHTDSYGKPKALTPKSSVQEVVGEPGSYFYDSGQEKVYVHTRDGREPDSNLLVLVTTNNGRQADGSNNLYVKNAIFMGGGQGAFRTGSGQGCVAVFENCEFTAGSSQSGMRCINTGLTISKNCEAYSNWLDGFNYHNSETYTPRAVEINCRAWANGVNKPTSEPTNSNASSAHENFVIVRVNTVGWSNNGTNIIDIQESYSWNVGCKAFDSISHEAHSKGDFRFVDDGVNAWLEGCEGGLSGLQIRAEAGSTVHVKDWSGGLVTDGEIIVY